MAAGGDDEERRGGAIGRRDLISGALGGVAGGILGAGGGYLFRDDLEALRAGVDVGVPGLRQFRAEADRLLALRESQTVDSAGALRAEFEQRPRVQIPAWDLVRRQALVVDTTDKSLYAGSQWLHVLQTLAAMEAQGVDDPDLHLVALLHDVGKVLVLDGAAPEHVFGSAHKLGDGEPGGGLATVPLQFGHWEIAHQRLGGRLPPHVAWTIRHHNVHPRAVRAFMTAEELDWAERYLLPFQRLESVLRSPFHVPSIAIDRYRELIERTFPQPVAF